MTKSEILAELPKLHADERAQVFERLCELQEADLLRGTEPGDAEKQLLDDALTAFERDGNPGIPWREALRRVRSSKTR